MLAAKIDEESSVAQLAGRVAAILVVAGPEPAPASGAPALDRAIVEEDAAMGPADLDGDRGSPRAVVGDGQGIAHLAGLVTVGRFAVAHPERPGDVAPPALDRAIVERGAGMRGKGVEAQGSAAGAEIDRQQRITHLARLVAAMLLVALSELAVEVPAPALHGAVIEERAGEAVAGGDRDGGTAGAEIDRRQRIAHLARLVAAHIGRA